jgi:hypothetical protein
MVGLTQGDWGAWLINIGRLDDWNGGWEGGKGCATPLQHAGAAPAHLTIVLGTVGNERAQPNGAKTAMHIDYWLWHWWKVEGQGLRCSSEAVSIRDSSIFQQSP